ncbi:MAG: glycosyltransferase family 4 protein [Gemmatimonadetes bacterium]|jgi:Fuc2NAc and GlcNAc transferase|nr:glycosyltransferase family 4 protein [Gemmatimonadota bacterium]MBT5058636.1 glycosyltransferase family 4 protein [Gemmatimonadota bacterium]MBT5144073.1 glycosyltransferase family 4 protein [Gemmatimonadota bacterium]MBT5590322.1 glycosyltransferase family 4 protein [Gemmatimonadota bacterium]MBT5964381.1 glycosyltransferase family 4 protein [Gemmatimonadota bacterium]
MNLSTVLVALLTGWSLTAILLVQSRRFKIVDEPNQRSSHTQPTPTLGGLAIVAATLLGGWYSELPGQWELWIATAALLVLTLDDTKGPLGVVAKVAIQLLAALLWVGMSDLSSIEVPLLGTLSGWPLSIVSVVWLVGWMNVFNFMDGIDAISGSQAITAGVSLAAVLSVSAADLLSLPLLVAAATGGFLIFNLPPARIFMGDVGSAFLGFCFAAIMLRAMAAGIPAYVVVLPVAGYLYDSMLTIARRACRGENILRAHRQHLYQRLSQRGWTHGQIAMAVALIGTLLGSAAYGFARGMVGWPIVQSLSAFVMLLVGTAATWHPRADLPND